MSNSERLRRLAQAPLGKQFFPPTVSDGAANPGLPLRTDENGDFAARRLTLDHIISSDQAGNTIPANAWGQKGGSPYFGDVRISRIADEVLRWRSGGIIAGSTGFKTQYIGSLQILATEMDESGGLPQFFDMSFGGNDIDGGIPWNAANPVYLFFTLNGQQPDLTNYGSALDVTPSNRIFKHDIPAGYLSLVEDTGNLKTALDTGGVATRSLEEAASNGGVATRTLNPAPTILNGALANAPVAQAGTWDVWIAANITVADFATVITQGSVRIIRQPVGTFFLA